MSIAKNTTYNLIGAITPLVLALATIPLYLGLVGAQRYGALAIAWLILGYFGLFDLGLGRATTQRIAALKNASAKERSNIFWTAVAVNIGMGLVGAVILYFVAHYFFGEIFQVDEELRPEIMAAVPFLAAAVPIATLTGVASGALQGREKFLEVNIVTIIGTSLFQLLPLAAAWHFGPTLKWLILAAIIARIVALIIFLARVHRHLLAGIKPEFQQSQWLALLKYGGWVTVTLAIGPIVILSDRLAIGALISAFAVTIYTVPFEIAQRLSLLPRSISSALFPRMAAADEEENLQISRRVNKVMCAIMSPAIFGAMVAMKPFLVLWIDQDFAIQSAELAIIFLLGWWINSFSIISFTKLQASNKPDVAAKALLIQIPFYLTLLYIVMEFFGLFGAAWLFAIRCFADWAIFSYLAQGKIIITRIMAIHLAALLATAAAAIFLEPFSQKWLGALLLPGLVIATTSARNFPAEAKPFFDEYLPSFLSRIFQFS